MLVAEGLHKRYGGVRALRGAGLVALSGRGARALRRERLRQVDAAQDRLGAGGRRPGARRARRRRGPLRRRLARARRGIATVTQETTLVDDLSVAENIFLGPRKPSHLARHRLARDTPARAPQSSTRLGCRDRPRRAGRPAAARPAADGRDRPRALDRRARADPGRADELAARRRGRVAVRGGADAEGRAASPRCSSRTG